MSFILLYCLKLSIGISSAYCFYFVFLRRLTFFKWNRSYLLASMSLSIVLPLFDVADYISVSNDQYPILTSFPPLTTAFTSPATISPTLPGFSFSWRSAFEMTIGVGIIFFLARLVIDSLSLRRIRKQALLLKRKRVSVYHLDGEILPFSFGRSIYLNAKTLTDKQMEEVIRHETAHAIGNHTVDITFAEILCCINWYNPFVWLIKQAIRQNLEFIADNQSLLNGSERKSYQYLLLSITSGKQFRLSNRFSFSSLTYRIRMMNANRSRKLSLVVYSLFLPITFILLMAFRGVGDFKVLSANSTPVKSAKPSNKTDHIPAGFITISGSSTKEEVKSFVDLLVKNHYDVDISEEVFDGEALREFTGVLSGEHFRESLTGPMKFTITSTNASVLGINPKDARLYWYHVDNTTNP